MKDTKEKGMAWPKLSLTRAHTSTFALSAMLGLLWFHKLAARGPSGMKECDETGGLKDGGDCG